jgi:hypothetical protein
VFAVSRVCAMGRVLPVVALAGVVACGAPATGPDPAGPASSRTSTAAGTPTPTGTPTAPKGWTVTRQGDLTFALPPGFTQVAGGAGMPGAAAQWTKAGATGLAVPPAVAVFVETGRVGPLGVRTELVRRARTAELGADPFGPARPTVVPGSLGATTLEWVWDYDVVAGRRPVPSRQIEVLVQAAGPRQYGLLIGAPATYLTDDLVDAFTASIAVLPTEGVA